MGNMREITIKKYYLFIITQEIQMTFNYQTSYNFIDLSEIESMALNTLISKIFIKLNFVLS